MGRLIRPSATLLLLTRAAVAEAPDCLDGSTAADRLEIASYNVQFTTPEVPILRHLLREIPGHKPNVVERAQAIAAQLACFDIIALQETINDSRRAELFAQMEHRGRACGKPSRLPSGRMLAVVDGPDLPDEAGWLPLVDNELALASRLPVVETSMHVFGDAAGVDVLAAKGVLHARLARGPEPQDLLDVFVTHLQANDEHGEARRSQIAELASIVRSTALGMAPIVVLGDFNVVGGNSDRADPDSDYNFLLDTLNEAVAPRRFVDLWVEMHPDDPETDSGTKRRVHEDGSVRPRERRVDFILLAGSDHAQPHAVRHDFFASDLVVDGEPVGDLSDHAAVLAQIDWLDGPSTCVRLSDSAAPR